MNKIDEVLEGRVEMSLQRSGVKDQDIVLHTYIHCTSSFREMMSSKWA